MSQQSRARTKRYNLFETNTIENLSKDDFALDSTCRICLLDLDEDVEKNKLREDCAVVLFYGEENTSYKLMDIWEQLSRETIGPTIAACNLSLEQDVSSAFENISYTAPPLKWAQLRSVPFIMSYVRGWPDNIYTGNFNIDPIRKFVKEQACYRRTQAPAPSTQQQAMSSKQQQKQPEQPTQGVGPSQQPRFSFGGGPGPSQQQPGGFFGGQAQQQQPQGFNFSGGTAQPQTFGGSAQYSADSDISQGGQCPQPEQSTEVPVNFSKGGGRGGKKGRGKR